MNKLNNFKKTIYFKSLASFNIKDIYAMLFDFSFLTVSYLIILLFSVFIENLDVSAFQNVQFNSALDSSVLSGIISFTYSWIFLVFLLVIILAFLYSFSRILIYQQFLKIKLSWKLFFKTSLITFVSGFSLILILLILSKLLIESVIGFVSLFLLILYVYSLMVIYINYFKNDTLKSVWEGFKLSFSKFYILFSSLLLSFFTLILVVLIFTSVFSILNFTNSNITNLIISFVSNIILLLGFAWMRKLMVLKINDLEKKKHSKKK